MSMAAEGASPTASPTHHKKPSIAAHYPFDLVVVTFPDEGAANVAIEGPLRDLKETYPNTKFLATCDPLGCRCGSGGGTLAALEHAVSVEGNKSPISQKTILILHAGGDSSRCFTQMALGKAWTNLPLVDDRTGDEVLSNPILLCMDSVARIFSQSHRLPRGSVVIAASDCLLSIPHYRSQGASILDYTRELGASHHDNRHPMPDVLGVTFPAAWETAKNHGVYVLSESSWLSNTDILREVEVPVRKILQKPSLETLSMHPFVAFPSMPKQERLAWIDNGIIAFLPKAARALHDLAYGILKTTTKSGLLQAMELTKGKDRPTPQDLTHKVDLYTHFLQALTISGDPGERLSVDEHREHYLGEYASDLDATVANGIFDALSPFQFQALAIPEGKFLHLGTTRELIDFYVHGCQQSSISQPSEVTSNPHKPSRHELYTQNCTFFGQELGLIRRMDVFVKWHDSNLGCNQKGFISKNCIIVGSALEGDSASSIGEGSVIEFCSLPRVDSVSPPGVIRLGKNCLVSGLRHQGDQPKTNLSLSIPDGTCMQMMPLVKEGESFFVVMALGVNDPIKNTLTESTLFGVDMESLLEWAGLSPDELWDANDSRTLWNAKLHPVISAQSNSTFAFVWDWLNSLSSIQEKNGVPELATASLTSWKTHSKVSLREVREQSDAAGEFRYRHDLVHGVVPALRRGHCQRLIDILWNREHSECDFYPLLVDTTARDKEVNDVQFVSSPAMQALQTLDEVIANALLDQSQYDICGRALMVESAILDDLAKVTFTGNGLKVHSTQTFATDINQSCSVFVKVIQSQTSAGADRQKAYTEIVAIRDAYAKSKGGDPQLRTVLKEFSEIMESIARTITEICVSGFLHDNSAFKGELERISPIVDQWVIATSPVRVDLSGGWTDTPPVCYEYGSAVTGVAVTVDGKKPLSCRCRIVSGKSDDQGIVLIRSELRDSKTCELISSAETELRELKDIQDARDPTASGALVKCALVCLGMLTVAMLQKTTNGAKLPSLQSLVDKFCQRTDGEHARLEIVVTSLLPQGSGMGTSSILGGCVLAAVGQCVGIKRATMIGNGSIDTTIIDSVSVLEQILGTGGGFQDQVNGLIGGVKTVSTKPHELPIRLSIEQTKLDADVQEQLDNRLFLAFTGKTRLAANILQNVLRRFARRTPEIVKCAQQLVDGAHKARDALQKGDVDALGQCLHEYWIQKKHMAGDDIGVEPEVVRRIIQDLKENGLICGGSLCGAGGGGFLVMIASADASESSIHAVVQQCLGELKTNDSFSWHECKICDEGLTTKVLPKGEHERMSDFAVSWHIIPA
jgi:galactokinase/mevalonate kinase-like predicted kinase